MYQPDIYHTEVVRESRVDAVPYTTYGTVQHREQIPVTSSQYTTVPHYETYPVTTSQYVPVEHTEPVEHMDWMEEIEYVDSVQYVPVTVRTPRTIYRQVKHAEPVTHMDLMEQQRTDYVQVGHNDLVETRRTDIVETEHTDLVQQNNVALAPHTTVSAATHKETLAPVPAPAQAVPAPAFAQNVVNPSIDAITARAVIKYAKIRFVNCIAKSKEINIAINGQIVAYKLDYKSSTLYFQVTADVNNLLISDYYTNRTLYNRNIALTEGEFSIFIHASVVKQTPIDILLIRDDNTCAGGSKVRFINPGAEIDPLTFIIQDYRFDNVAYGRFTNYANVKAGPTNLKVIDNSNKTIINSTIDIKPNHVYTIYSMGIKGDGDAPLLVKLLIDSSNCQGG